MMWTGSGAGTLIADYAYEYDLANRLVEKVENSVTTTYGYDAIGQITSNNGSSLTYDDTGNRTLTGYVTTDGNRMTSDGVWTYTHDLDGNVVGKSKSGEAWTYEYDLRGQMTEATDGTTTVSYAYDAFGNRIGRTEDGGTTVTEEQYVQDGWDPAKSNTIGTENFDAILDLDGDDDVIARHVFGPGHDDVVARQDAGVDVHWYVADRLGSVRAAFDNAGTVTNAIDYDAFGGFLGGVPVDRYGFAGREWDAALGLQYNRARMYDPSTGRWMGEDGIRQSAGDVNLFRYVGNGPTNATDPSGFADPLGWIQRNAGSAYDEVTMIGNYVVSSATEPISNNYRNLRATGSSTIGAAGLSIVASALSPVYDGVVNGGDAVGRNYKNLKSSGSSSIVAAPTAVVGTVLDPVYSGVTGASDRVEVVFTQQRQSGSGTTNAGIVTALYALASVVGYTEIDEAVEGTEIESGRKLSSSERWSRGLRGFGTAVLSATAPFVPKSKAVESFTTCSEPHVGFGSTWNKVPAGRGAKAATPSSSGKFVEVPKDGGFQLVADAKPAAKLVPEGGAKAGSRFVEVPTDGGFQFVADAKPAAKLVPEGGTKAGSRFVEMPRDGGFLQVAPNSGVQANKAAGDAVRDLIAAREAPALVEQSFSTVGGVRRVDVLKLGDEIVGIESKVGRTALDSRVRQELARDWWLRRQRRLDRVVWEFSPSDVTGKVGPTKQLLAMLQKLGFDVRINEP